MSDFFEQSDEEKKWFESEGQEGFEDEREAEQAHEDAPSEEEDEISEEQDDSDSDVEQEEDGGVGDADDLEEEHAEGAKVVPLAALQAEREKRRELARKLEATESKVGGVDSKLEEIFAVLREKNAVVDDDDLEFNKDPLGWMYDNVMRIKEDRKREVAARTEYVEQATAQQQMIAAYHNDVTQFSRTNPDFMDAYNHVLSSRRDEYIAMGYDSAKASAMIIGDETEIVRKALQDGCSPAERMYNLAKLRGFSNKQEPASPKKTVEQAKQKMQEKKRKEAASMSLGNVSGSSAKNEVSAEDLLNMSDSDFRNIEDLSEVFSSVFGGPTP